MKKYYVSIIIILLSITSIYAYYELYGNQLDMEDIIQINLYYNDEIKDSYTPNRNSDSNYDNSYLKLLEALNSIKKIDPDISVESNYQFDIASNAKLDRYKFYIDLDNSNIYVSTIDSDSNKTQYYQIPPEHSNDLFNENFFKEIYYEKTIFNTKFNIGNSSIFPSIQGDISYVTPNEVKKDSKVTHASKSYLSQIDDYNTQNTLSITFPSQVKQMHVTAYDGDRLISIIETNSDKFKLLKRDGITSYKVKLTWEKSDLVYFDGTITYSFDIDMDLSPEYELVANNKGAGEFFVIKALYFNEDEKPLVESDFIRNKDFEKIGDEYLLIIPLNYYQRKANYNVQLYVLRDDTKELIDTIELLVANRDFTAQHLTIDKATVAATSTDKAYTEFAQYFTPTREYSNPKAYFTESFILPIDGRISTEFGMMRYINGSLTSYRHSGIDIAVAKGTPIPATNSGKIVLSREFILTGNTIVIDHGVGLFSVYYHMDSLSVSKDDMVKRYDIIGTVGSTGRSTGPHLHFTTSFYKTNMNPNFLINLSNEELENLIN